MGVPKSSGQGVWATTGGISACSKWRHWRLEGSELVVTPGERKALGFMARALFPLSHLGPANQHPRFAWSALVFAVWCVLQCGGCHGSHWGEWICEFPVRNGNRDWFWAQEANQAGVQFQGRLLRVNRAKGDMPSWQRGPTRAAPAGGAALSEHPTVNPVLALNPKPSASTPRRALPPVFWPRATSIADAALALGEHVPGVLSRHVKCQALGMPECRLPQLSAVTCRAVLDRAQSPRPSARVLDGVEHLTGQLFFIDSLVAGTFRDSVLL